MIPPHIQELNYCPFQNWSCAFIEQWGKCSKKGSECLCMPTKQLSRHDDARGSFTELLRIDWKDILGDINFSQINFSITFPTQIRAWKRHLKKQIDFFFCLKGLIKLCVFDESKKELHELFLSGDNPRLVKVDGFYWHGFKAIDESPSITLYFTNNLYNYKEPDEERIPYNSDRIKPDTINGQIDDSRVSEAYVW